MTAGRVIAAWAGVATLAALSTCAPIAPAEGQSWAASAGPAIAIGSLSSTSGGSRARQTLRDALATELTSLRGVRITEPRGAAWVLRGSVTELSRRQVHDDVHVDCAVSLVVADASGNVRVMLSGRAGARGGGDAAHVERTAVQAAVRGALRPLPRSLR